MRAFWLVITLIIVFGILMLAFDWIPWSLM